MPGPMVIVFPHNVELCKQYFLQKCLRFYCKYKRLKEGKVKFLIEDV